MPITVPAYGKEAAERLASMADVTADDGALRRFLHGLPGVDAVGLQARAATLGTRSIKTTAKAYAIDLAISMIDLTTLEGADTPGKVRALCAKGITPDPTDRTAPRVAAICVYPDMVATAKEALLNGGPRTSMSRPSPPPSRPAGPRCRSSSPTPVTRSRPAPTRSTW